MHADRARPVHIGCSGWNYGHWRNGVFYPSRLPASRWLEFYAERFDTVEVNSTFYRLPLRDAVCRWLEQTPEGFVLAFKTSRYLTHVKRLRDLGPGLERFLERIEPLLGSPKLGPFLWQLPPTFRRDPDRLAKASSGCQLQRLRAARMGQSGCEGGAARTRSSPTSTTTGRGSRRGTRRSRRGCSGASA